MEAWWGRFPGILEAEIDALTSFRLPWRIDEAARKEGRLIIYVQYPHSDAVLELTAIFPATYPYFPPVVRLDKKRLRRHQHPVEGTLCLLAREGDEWQPGIDTLGRLLKEQLPKILSFDAEEGSLENVAEIEDRVGEPLSAFLPSPNGCVVIVPDGFPNAEESAGRLRLRLRSSEASNPDPYSVAAMVEKITDLSGNKLISSPILPSIFNESIQGFWLRLTERPSLTSGSDLSRSLFELIKLKNPKFKKKLDACSRGHVLVAGFIYPDETSWRTSTDDWLFLGVRIEKASKGRRGAKCRLWFMRPDYGGEAAVLMRAPALAHLRNKSALLVGLGSLGCPVALQLARAGIKVLHVLDHDYAQVGNSIRWPFGWTAAGCSKVEAAKAYMQRNYPYTELHGHRVRIGLPTPVGTSSDYDLVFSIANQVDVIIDATASHRVSHFLADLARELGKAYVWLTTTHGAAGGVVGRILPGRTTGCWHCFQYSLGEGAVRLPADGGSDELQARGCSQPTFIGAGVDSDEIALLASRLAIATLCRGAVDAYPDFAWDVAVADLQGDSKSLAPKWDTYSLEPHPTCSACTVNELSLVK